MSKVDGRIVMYKDKLVMCWLMQAGNDCINLACSWLRAIQKLPSWFKVKVNTHVGKAKERRSINKTGTIQKTKNYRLRSNAPETHDYNQ